MEIFSLTNKSETSWRLPEVAFANANDPMFFELKKFVSPTHLMPADFIEDASTVICYFIPFEKHIVNSNTKEHYSSKEWAKAYFETNSLIEGINYYIQQQLTIEGYNSSIIPVTHNFKEATLLSDWSHRHVSYIAGLGTFGINRMLITKSGCCGRLGSIVTNMYIEPTKRPANEYCLYKNDPAMCGLCLTRCVSQSLKVNEFDRFKCYEICLENNSRLFEDEVTDVCGKCLAGVPCSLCAPGFLNGESS